MKRLPYYIAPFFVAGAYVWCGAEYALVAALIICTGYLGIIADQMCQIAEANEHAKSERRD